MTSIFQTLINFLDYFLNPVYNVLYSVVVNFFYGLLTVLNTILYCLQTVVNGVIFGFFWCLDRFFVTSITCIHAIFGSTGLLSGLTQSTTMSGILSYGAVGISWVKNFVNLAVIVTPFFTYVTFLLFWSVYKFVKSWIPFVGK